MTQQALQPFLGNSIKPSKKQREPHNFFVNPRPQSFQGTLRWYKNLLHVFEVHELPRSDPLNSEKLKGCLGDGTKQWKGEEDFLELFKMVGGGGEGFDCDCCCCRYCRCLCVFFFLFFSYSSCFLLVVSFMCSSHLLLEEKNQEFQKLIQDHLLVIKHRARTSKEKASHGNLFLLSDHRRVTQAHHKQYHLVHQHSKRISIHLFVWRPISMHQATTVLLTVF